MPTGATFDKSRLLPLYARINEAGEVIQLTFVDDAAAAFDISSLDFVLKVYKRPNSTSAQFTLTIGDGLSVTGAGSNKLNISLTAARATQSPNTYFYRLYSDDEDSTWLNGSFEFHNGEFDGVNSPDEITVTNSGTAVTITVEGGASGGGHTIQNAGSDMTQRTNLNFIGLTVTDDSVNDATKVALDTTAEGALISGATAKTTPVDADFIGLMDSAASNILKKLSWSNIKATLKTYFDTLYLTTVAVDGTSVTGNGTAGNPLVATGSGLQAANNLGDVSSALESRQNLQAAHDRLTIFDKSSAFTVALTDFYSAGTRKTNPEYYVTATATATLKQDSDENIPVGSVANFRVATGVTLTFAAGSGATVTTSSGGFTLVGSSSGPKYGFAVKTAASTWVVMNGDPASGNQMVITFVASLLTHTNLPSGVQRVSNAANRYGVRVDVTNASTIRAGVACSLAGASGSGWYCRYSTNGSTYTDIGTATGGDLALMTSAGINISNAITMPAAAKSFGMVWLEIVSINGDGAADPVTGTLFAIIT